MNKEEINRIITNRDFNGSHSDTYEKLFGEKVSETEARKRLYGIRDYLKKEDEFVKNRILCISDLHVPFQLPVDTYRDFVGIVDTLVINGDVVDCTSISKFPKMYRSDLVEDMKEAKNYIIEIVKLIRPKKVVINDGNHDIRLGAYLSRNVDFDVAQLLPNSVLQLICNDGFYKINKKTIEKEYITPLCDDMIKIGVMFEYTNDWKCVIGDSIFTHPKSYSSGTLKTAEKAKQFFQDNYDRPFKTIVMAHTHDVALSFNGNIILIEQGTCSKVELNNYADGLLQRRQQKGFVYLCQDKNGNTLQDKIKLVRL